ncbi:MAG: aldo/keto reductase [Anaerolineae bacterium]|nr:MAG: aldo/keto reductase [Anaerolineae bacterium]
MEYRRLGGSGLKISALSLGSWVTFGRQLDTNLAENCMAAAYDAGVNFFDNAEAYAHGESEIIMGEALKKLAWPRDSYIVSSKVYWGSVATPLPTQQGLSRKHVFDACNQALKRLQLDYLDLYFCHRPDRETPIEETVRAMSDLISQGKILYWGTSEWSAQEIMEAYGAARQFNLVPPTMEQPQYNMFHRDRFEIEYHRLYEEIGLGTTIWSPLASGLLTGKYNSGIPQDSRANLEGFGWLKERFKSDVAQRQIVKVKNLAKLADELSTNMPRLAIAWCLKNPRVSTVITGASRLEQVLDNLEALNLLSQLDAGVMEQIEQILDNKPKFPQF